MMKMIGICRLGTDAIVRYSADKKPYANLWVAWNYGRPDENKKQPTQWMSVNLIGDRAEKLAPFLTKGTSLFLDIRDARVEMQRNKEGVMEPRLIGSVDSIAFAGNKAPAEKKPTPSDDIPF